MAKFGCISEFDVDEDDWARKRKYTVLKQCDILPYNIH